MQGLCDSPSVIIARVSIHYRTGELEQGLYYRSRKFLIATLRALQGPWVLARTPGTNIAESQGSDRISTLQSAAMAL